MLPKIEVSEASFPVAPAHLSDKWKASWLVFWTSPFASLVQPAQHPAIERLFGLYDERDRMDVFIREQPMTMGSQGQPVVNPLYRQRSAMDAEIRQLEDRFGLHPRAGLALGIQFGEAARSLEELNARIAYAANASEEPEEDPRRIEQAAAEA